MSYKLIYLLVSSAAAGRADTDTGSPCLYTLLQLITYIYYYYDMVVIRTSSLLF